VTVLIDVKNLTTEFHTEAGVVRAVDNISYTINEREIIGVVGESGCGKSVSQLSIMQLIPSPGVVKGHVIFENKDLLNFQPNGPEMRAVRGSKIAMIFQEPMTSLNPTLSIGWQMKEMLEVHLGMNTVKAQARCIELLQMVGIPGAEKRLDDFPHQFSGGMRQRVIIAMMMACNPKLLIADEPTTALDVTTQAQLLELMKEMVNKMGASLVIVTHNLGVVARYADRINVMYAGRIIETGTCKEIFHNPRHPYTIGLLKSVPRLDEEEGRKLSPIPGMPPNLIGLGKTCAFLRRCPYRMEKCLKEPWPELASINGTGHSAACYARIEEKIDLVSAAPDATKKATFHGEESTLLEVKNLKMYFPVTRGLFRRHVADVKAVDDVSFKLKRGETLGLVGESGCGKTTVGRCIMRLYTPTSGDIFINGKDTSKKITKDVNQTLKTVALTFQDPYGSLNPRQTAGSIVGEPLRLHKLVNTEKEYEERVAMLFKMVGLNPEMKGRVPHEFSGGQRQRIGIARALAMEPTLIVCDEPISALDVSIQAQIINLLEDLQASLKGLSYLFIAHDLSVVRHLSQRVAVMYLGHIVEITTSRELLRNPMHPYTKALLSAIPIPDPYVEEKRSRIILKGEVPSPLNPPSGCTFHPRCQMATKECQETKPVLRDFGSDHEVACIKV